jgi:hypothetical protein
MLNKLASDVDKILGIIIPDLFRLLPHNRELIKKWLSGGEVEVVK